jgi:hypothetical protein
MRFFLFVILLLACGLALGVVGETFIRKYNMRKYDPYADPAHIVDPARLWYAETTRNPGALNDAEYMIYQDRRAREEKAYRTDWSKYQEQAERERQQKPELVSGYQFLDAIRKDYQAKHPPGGWVKK